MLTSSITQNGAMTCTSFAIVNNTAGESNTNMTISQTGDIECANIKCSSVLLNSALWQPTIERVVLDFANPTSVPPSAARIPGWSYIWNGNGRFIKFGVQITCYNTNGGRLGYWYLRKGIPDSGQSSIVATSKFFHNQANVHTTRQRSIM